MVLRLGADLLVIGASSVSPEGILYRAWDGLRLSLAAGYSFPIRGLSLGVAAGGALTAAEYRGTPLIFAYPSILALAELSLPVASNMAVRVGIPLEVMLRGAYTDFSPGISAVFAYSFELGASK